MTINHNQETERDVGSLLDPNTFLDASNAAFSGLASQLALQYLTSPIRRPQQGIITTAQNRLTVSPISFELMVIFLIGDILLCLALMSVLSRRSPCPSAALGCLATIFAQSKVEEIFNHFGTWSMGEIEQRTNELKFAVKTQGNGSLLRIKYWENREPVHSYVRFSDSRWWQPFSGTRLYILSLLTLLAILITILEIVHRVSSDNVGLGDVQSRGNLHLIWTYVPALMMTLATLLVQSTNTTMRLLEPFSMLRKGNASGNETLLTDHLRDTALVIIPRSFTKKRIALLASTVSVCLGPILTVAVSGLFSPILITCKFLSHKLVELANDLFRPNLDSSVVSLEAMRTFNFSSLQSSVPGDTDLLDSDSFSSEQTSSFTHEQITDNSVPAAMDAGVATLTLLRNLTGELTAVQAQPLVSFRAVSDDHLFANASTLSAVVPSIQQKFDCSTIDYTNETLVTGEIATSGAQGTEVGQYLNLSLAVDPGCPSYQSFNTTIGIGVAETVFGEYNVAEGLQIEPQTSLDTYTFGFTLWQKPVSTF